GTFSTLAAPHQSCANRKCCRHASQCVAQWVAHTQRSTLRITRDTHQSRQALNDLVICRRCSQWSFLTKTRNGTVNQIRLDAFEHLITQPQPVHYPWSEVLEHDIRSCDQFFEHCHILLVLEVQNNRAFAPILSQKRCAQIRFVQGCISAQLTCQIPAIGGLDL